MSTEHQPTPRSPFVPSVPRAFVDAGHLGRLKSVGREATLDLLNQVWPRNGIEAQAEADALSFCSTDESALDPRNTGGHFTASGVVVSQESKVLLVWHKKYRQWLQLGGHAKLADGGHLIRVAYREVAEESGLEGSDSDGLRIWPIPIGIHGYSDTDPLHLDEHLPGMPHQHFDLRLLCRMEAGYPAVRKTPSKLRWASWDELDALKVSAETKWLVGEALSLDLALREWDEESARRVANFQGVITVDGPAGAGKSTLARHLAEAFRVPYLNTGIMYRALAAAFLSQHLSVGNAEEVAKLAGSLEFDIVEAFPPQLSIGGKKPDVDIWSRSVEGIVPQIASHESVRAIMRNKQRALLPESGIAEGRDMGRVVFPEAATKFFLSAAPHVRVRRRLEERRGDQEVEEIERRDLLDSKISPLEPPDGAVVLDSSSVGPHELLRKAIKLVHTRSARTRGRVPSSGGL